MQLIFFYAKISTIYFFLIPILLSLICKYIFKTKNNEKAMRIALLKGTDHGCKGICGEGGGKKMRKKEIPKMPFKWSLYRNQCVNFQGD